MKHLLLNIVLLFTINCMAQKPCDFETDVKDSLGNYKSTKAYLMSEKNFGGNSNYLFFALELTDGLPTLNVQTIQKSKSFNKAYCLDKNSKIYLQLQNGKIITLIHTDQENCGTSVKDMNGFDNRLTAGVFMFLKNTFEDLKSSPISFLRIKYTTEMVDYVIKKEFKAEMDNLYYHPENYFIDALHCIEN
ncbi:MAG: hypothetical protein V4548_05300 [Bacteroidota bacterium]